MSLSGSPRSRCTVTVSHTLVVLRSGPSATLLRHYASRRICQAVTCLTARRLPGHLLPYRDLLSFKRNPSRKTISIWSRFVRQTSDALARYKIHGNRYTSRVSTRMRTYFQIIESNETNLIWVVQKYTRALNLIINCKNFKTFFWSINNHMYINNDFFFI